MLKLQELDRYTGYSHALEEFSIPIKNKNTIFGGFDMESGYAGAKKLWSNPSVPDCLFCATDNIATGVLLYLRENGIKVPDDVIITSIGDSKAGQLCSVPLTTAHFHYKTAGAEAANIMLANIKQPDLIPRSIKLDYSIVYRESMPEYM